MSDSIELSDIDINIGGGDGVDTITLDTTTSYPNYYSSGTSSVTVPQTFISSTASPGLTVGGINSYQYPNTSTWAINSSRVTNSVSGELQLDGTNPDIKLGDRSLKEFMDNVEERLAILHPNEELESRWEQLKELRKQYVELEKELLEKEKMWELLKKE